MPESLSSDLVPKKRVRAKLAATAKRDYCLPSRIKEVAKSKEKLHCAISIVQAHYHVGRRAWRSMLQKSASKMMELSGCEPYIRGRFRLR